MKLSQPCFFNDPAKTAVIRIFTQYPLKCLPVDYLADTTQLEASVVANAIEILIQEGLTIGYRPMQGYFFEPQESILHPDMIAAHLTTRWWGHRIVVGNELTSTIDVAKELLNQPDSHGTVVIANMQTVGRGRLGNQWVSRKGRDILLTFIVESTGWQPSASLLSLYAATAAARVLDTAYQLPIAIKWPNDLMVHNRKVGGVLVEWAEKRDHFLISLGLNVHSLPSDWPLELRGQSASLCMMNASEEWHRDKLTAQMGTTWETLWETMRMDTGECIKGYWRQYSTTLGKTVTMEYQGKTITGFTQAIDDEGRLVFIEDNGVSHVFLPEEVRSIRVI